MAYAVTRRLDNYVVPNRLFQLLHYLTTFADDFGGSVRPSIDRMAWGTGMAKETIKDHLKSLKKLGVLIVSKEGTRVRSTEYRLNLEVLPGREPYVRPERRGWESTFVRNDEGGNPPLSK
jgi:hypothetical protein